MTPLTLLQGDTASAPDEVRPEPASRERRATPLRSFELHATARGLRSALTDIEGGLGNEVETNTRKEIRLVMGELVARWLQCGGGRDPMVVDVAVMADRVRLEIAAATGDRGDEFWKQLCSSPTFGAGIAAGRDRRRGIGAFIEVPRSIESFDVSGP